MSNISSYNNHTIALDSKGKVLFCAEINFVAAQDFVTIARDAETIITGNNLTGSVSGFIGHENVRNIYILNENLYSSVNTFYNSRGYVNESGESVTVTKINSIEELNFNEIIFENDKYFIKDNVSPFEIFEVKGDGVADDTEAINFAIACVTNIGGKLIFKGDATYAISSPIKICSPNNQSDSKDFIIDFNNSRITVVNGSTFNTPNLENLPDSMIYVNYDITDSQKSGKIQNVQLYPGIYQDENGAYKPRADIGLYLASSLRISYLNFKILDVTTGVYIAENSNYIIEKSVVMDNIQISKSRGFSPTTSLLDFPEPRPIDNEIHQSLLDEISGNYSSTQKVGIDCRADSCNFSNIIVIDYLVGMRVIGEKNNVYGAHIWNTYCPEQYKRSVGFINGGKSDSITDNPENIYTACVADKFHIGWLSSDTANFTLINCHWYNKELDIFIDKNADEVKDVFKNQAYGFYIPDGTDGIIDDYEDNEIGSNITAIDCYMVGSDLDNDECFTNFCNRKDHSINYTGPVENTFHAPNSDAPIGRIAMITSSATDVNKLGDKTLSFNGDTAELVNLSSYNYNEGDVVCVSFKYNITGVTGAVNSWSPLNVKYDGGLTDYFDIDSAAKDNDKITTVNLSFPSSEGEVFLSFLQLGDNTQSKKILIKRDNSNANATISELRLIKIPATWNFPKYYLEPADKYKARIIERFKNFEYNDEIVITTPTNTNLAFMSLPFKYIVKNASDKPGDPVYTLTYFNLGRPYLEKTNDNDINSFKNTIRLKFDSGNHIRLYGRISRKYLNFEGDAVEISFGVNQEEPTDTTMIDRNEELFSYDFNNECQKYNTSYIIPNFGNKKLVLTNIINNPYGYHFETPIDACNSDGEFIPVQIPLYPDGEVRLIAKNSTYSTGLPTVLISEVD